MSSAPPPRIVVTAAVIERDGRYLVTRRLRGTHLAGFWEFPGGKCNLDEPLAACLEREIAEELDTDILVGAEIHQVAHEYPERIVELHFFRCELVGEPRAVLGQEMRWVARESSRRSTFHPPTPNSSTCSPGLISISCCSNRCRRALNRRARGDAEKTRAFAVAHQRQRRHHGRRYLNVNRDGDSGPRLDEIPVDVAQGDRPPQRGRQRGAGDRANLPIAAPDRSPVDWHRDSRLERQAHQPSRHASVAAVQHADDDLLADVAPLRQADRAVLDARLERNRVLGHVLPEDRPAMLDPSDLGG